MPTNPYPATGAGSVSTTPILTWTATGATSYAVRFGPVYPPPNVGTYTAASFKPGTLAMATTYYWQVIAYNNGLYTAGPVWQFKTNTGKAFGKRK
jgi:hypothetical protein